MRSRLVTAVAALVAMFVACGGEPFTGSGSDETAGAGAVGGRPPGSGGSSSGGRSGSSGSSGKAGSSGSGATGGVVNLGGALNVGGVLGISGNAGQPGTSCDQASDCKASSACVRATCVDGKCSDENVPDGPFEQQAPADCKQARCESGRETIALDPTDYDDEEECTADACDGDEAIHTPRTGEQCAQGLCSAQGECEPCNVLLCSLPGPCQMNLCSNNACELALKPAGATCGGTPGNPNQCNAMGACVDCVDNAGCPAEFGCTAGSSCSPI